MGFVKFNQAKQPTFVKCMIYGVAGVGKTTFALSAPGPQAIIDFDNGLHRTNYQHRYNADVLQPIVWQDVIDALADVNAMRQYKTIIVDTIDKMMDYVISKVCGNRQPNIKDWGPINQEFTNFCRMIDNIGINVIFLSHEAKDQERDIKNKDVTKYKPSLRDKSFVYIQNSLDILGFMSRTDEAGRSTRMLTLNSTICECKQPSGMPDVIVVPECLDKNGNKTIENDAFDKLILAPYVAGRQREAEAMNAYSALMSAIRNDIASISDVDSANAFLQRVESYQHIGNSKVECRNLLWQKTTALGLHYDKNVGAYVAA